MQNLDYYLTLNSPWSYLGHGRLSDMVARHGVSVQLHPVDFPGAIFPVTGGLPVGKRSPQRQAYRLVELERWRDHLGIPLNLQPAHWPVEDALAAQMVIAARESGADALTLAGALLAAVWSGERDIGDRDCLLAIAGECELDGDGLLVAADTAEMAEQRALEAREAVERGVFGAPTYVFNGELFWGQDRLEFLERAMSTQ
jgi:carboxymethylenebutenolidase